MERERTQRREARTPEFIIFLCVLCASVLAQAPLSDEISGGVGASPTKIPLQNFWVRNESWCWAMG